MKIAMVAEYISRKNGGIFPVMCALARELERQQIDVRLFGCADEYTIADCRENGVAFDAASPLWQRGIRYCPEIRRRLREFAPDVIHLHGIWNYPEFVAAGLGVPYVVSPHGMVDPWALENGRLKKRMFAMLFEHRVWLRAGALHALCASEAAAIRSFWPAASESTVIPNGVTLPADATACPVSDGKKELLYLGRLHPKKGAHNLIPAFLRTAPSDWRLVIAGWGRDSFVSELRKLAAGNPAVVFAGPLFGTAKEEALRRCSAFVLPSYSEGLPMAVLEAWAYRKPALLTDFCNLPEGIETGAAFRLEPDVVALEKFLTAFFQFSPAQLAAMGERGEALVREKFAWNHIALTFLELYRRLSNGRGSVRA